MKAFIRRLEIAVDNHIHPDFFGTSKMARSSAGVRTRTRQPPTCTATIDLDCDREFAERLVTWLREQGAEGLPDWLSAPAPGEGVFEG